MLSPFTSYHLGSYLTLCSYPLDLDLDLVPHRLAEADLSPEQISAIKGTGRNRMLTKGDVLAALGKISHAKGSMKGIPKTVYGVSAGYGDVSPGLFEFGLRFAGDVYDC